ncbi:MAG: DUF3576 domain-containing protein [Rhodospirillales bacterium]|nr:DUF3576 domain-containing protein [Rhodospirillales bacterium]
MINKLQSSIRCGRTRTPIYLVLSIIFILTACEEGKPQPNTTWSDGEMVDMDNRETIFGTSGGFSFGDASNSNTGGGGPSIGVNAFLWRATLDTMSVWPINSADPFGGVVITDWYAPPATPNERFKMNIYILDRALRPDGVRVSVFRQVKNTAGDWQDAIVQPTTATKLENAILMRARQFRNRTNQ